MLLETEEGIWARADATVFKLLMDGQRTERRLQAAGRTVANAHRRVAALRRMRAASDARAHDVAQRQVAEELAAAWGKSLHVRVPRNLERSTTNSVKKRRAALIGSTAPRAIRAYKAPLVDSRGRIALYLRIRYVGLKSKNWRPGLAADHALYILREHALENGDIALDVVPLSNMGVDAEEIAACWDALEAVEEGYRANAKVQYRIVWNLPHDLTAAERREMVEGFCERTFGRLGLPWVAGIHRADQRGDQRNHHAHICFSTRPCERTGTHQWSIAQEKVNGLTDEDGLKLMRALVAGHMNLACRDAGLAVRFTHQTYKDRGIDAERQEHVGPAAMAAHEAGEDVAVIARNAARVEANELAAERDRVARAVTAAERLVHTEQRRTEMAQVRAGIAVVTATAGRISKAARTPASRPARDGVGARGIQLKAIAARATAMGAAIGRPVTRPQREIAGMALSAIAARSADLAAALKLAEANRAGVQALRIPLAGFTTAKQQRADRAKAAILTAPMPPYRVVGGQAMPEYGVLAANDRALVLELDADARLAILRERIKRDHEQRLDDRRRERERLVEQERVRAAQRAEQARRDHERQQEEEGSKRALAAEETRQSEARERELARRELAKVEEARRVQAEAERARVEAEAEQARLADIEERRAREQEAGREPNHHIKHAAASIAEAQAPSSVAQAVGVEERLARLHALAWAARHRQAITAERVKATRRDRPAHDREPQSIASDRSRARPEPPRRSIPPGFNPDDRER